MAAIIFFVGIGYPVIGSSKPGDALYGVKRGIEDLRSKIQPSHDGILLEKRNNEIEDLKNSGGSDQEIEKAEQEKQEIEDRIERRGSSGDERNSEKTEHQDSDRSESDVNNEVNSEVDDEGDRDTCRAELDQKKQNGEPVVSDDYKACDNL
jgi:hypothetical protein